MPRAKSRASRRPRAQHLWPNAANSLSANSKGAARDMYESMSEEELEEMASTKRKGKPEHVSKARGNK